MSRRKAVVERSIAVASRDMFTFAEGLIARGWSRSSCRAEREFGGRRPAGIVTGRPLSPEVFGLGLNHLTRLKPTARTRRRGG